LLFKNKNPAFVAMISKTLGRYTSGVPDFVSLHPGGMHRSVETGIVLLASASCKDAFLTGCRGKERHSFFLPIDAILTDCRFAALFPDALQCFSRRENTLLTGGFSLRTSNDATVLVPQGRHLSLLASVVSAGLEQNEVIFCRNLKITVNKVLSLQDN
jgi:hypothetical protein